MDIFILCTRHAYRGQGIASNLVHTALDNARAEGVEEVFSMGLSNFSKKIFTRMGFTERASIHYCDYDQDNEKIFDLRQMGDHETGVLFTAKLGEIA